MPMIAQTHLLYIFLNMIHSFIPAPTCISKPLIDTLSPIHIGKRHADELRTIGLNLFESLGRHNEQRKTNITRPQGAPNMTMLQ